MVSGCFLHFFAIKCKGTRLESCNSKIAIACNLQYYINVCMYVCLSELVTTNRSNPPKHIGILSFDFLNFLLIRLLLPALFEVSEPPEEIMSGSIPLLSNNLISHLMGRLQLVSDAVCQTLCWNRMQCSIVFGVCDECHIF